MSLLLPHEVWVGIVTWLAPTEQAHARATCRAICDAVDTAWAGRVHAALPCPVPPDTRREAARAAHGAAVCIERMARGHVTWDVAHSAAFARRDWASFQRYLQPRVPLVDSHVASLDAPGWMLSEGLCTRPPTSARDVPAIVRAIAQWGAWLPTSVTVRIRGIKPHLRAWDNSIEWLWFPSAPSPPRRAVVAHFHSTARRFVVCTVSSADMPPPGVRTAIAFAPIRRHRPPTDVVVAYHVYTARVEAHKDWAWGQAGATLWPIGAIDAEDGRLRLCGTHAGNEAAMTAALADALPSTAVGTWA